MRFFFFGEHNGSSARKTVVAAVRNESEKLRPKTNNLADLTHIIQGLTAILPVDEVPKILLERVPRGDIREFDENRVLWLVMHDGTWIVRMVQRCVAYHAVVVDGVNQVVWDSVPDYLLYFVVDLLRGCGGQNARKSKILEVILLVV